MTPEWWEEIKGWAESTRAEATAWQIEVDEQDLDAEIQDELNEIWRHTDELLTRLAAVQS